MHANPCTPTTPPPAMPPHVLTPDVWNVLLAIRERAKATGATPAQRVRALEVGIAERQAGRSQAVAVAEAVKHLPRLRGLRLVEAQ
ncbi:MAG: hypothetical protein GX761_10040 [Gammaproteobacteria bacterium]|nr:hypothetical protein [Gammaproteobacteria bacterium]